MCDKQTLLATLNDEILNCKKCCLADKQILYGHGNRDSEIMMIGESPSLVPEGNKQVFGHKSLAPFTAFLQTLGLKLEDVYITNIVKCYIPHENTGNQKHCIDIVLKEINIVNPEYIILFGKKVSQILLERYIKTAADLNGGYYPTIDRKYFTVYHPMVVNYRTITLEEYKAIAEKVRKIISKG